MTARTHGLTHLAFAVSDPERSAAFYVAAFGAKVTWQGQDSVQLEGSGPHDLLTLFRDAEKAGAKGGIDHFGFRLKQPEDVDAAVEAVLAAGGELIRRGQHAPNVPYAYFRDPDGYVIEVWFE